MSGVNKDNLGRHEIYVNAGYIDGKYLGRITTSKDLGCASRYKSKVMIKFSNGDVKEFIHIGKTDCRNTSISFLLAPKEVLKLPKEEYFIYQEEVLQYISSNQIEQIRIIGTEKTQDFKLKKPEVFIKSLRCIQSQLSEGL